MNCHPCVRNGPTTGWRPQRDKDDVIGCEDDEHVVFQPVNSLYSEYVNRKIVVGETEKGKPDIKPLFTAWLGSKTRRS